jgi:hypothetical protein
VLLSPKQFLKKPISKRILKKHFMTLANLAIDHPYMASDSNYYSNEASATFRNWDAFLAEWGDADRDYNLCFRFDVTEKDRKGTYRAQLSILQQRKGIYFPITITTVKEEDVESIVEWLTPYWNLMISLWAPLSNK